MQNIVQIHDQIQMLYFPFNPNSLDNTGSWTILKDFCCSVTMLRELGLRLYIAFVSLLNFWCFIYKYIFFKLACSTSLTFFCCKFKIDFSKIKFRPTDNFIQLPSYCLEKIGYQPNFHVMHTASGWFSAKFC